MSRTLFWCFFITIMCRDISNFSSDLKTPKFNLSRLCPSIRLCSIDLYYYGSKTAPVKLRKLSKTAVIKTNLRLFWNRVYTKEKKYSLRQSFICGNLSILFSYLLIEFALSV